MVLVVLVVLAGLAWVAATAALVEPAGAAAAGREPIGSEQLADAPVFRARAAPGTGSAARRGREAPATREFAAGRVAVPAV